VSTPNLSEQIFVVILCFFHLDEKVLSFSGTSIHFSKVARRHVPENCSLEAQGLGFLSSSPLSARLYRPHTHPCPMAAHRFMKRVCWCRLKCFIFPESRMRGALPTFHLHLY